MLDGSRFKSFLNFQLDAIVKCDTAAEIVRLFSCLKKMYGGMLLAESYITF